MNARLRHRLGQTAATLVLLAFFALAGVLLLPAAAGYQRYVIQTGSMTGTLDPGSLIYDKAVPVSALKKGDVITYGPPGAKHQDIKLVTHRIHSIDRVAGRFAIRTKGDANNAPDPWTFTPQRPTLPRVDGHLPYLGYAYAELNTRQGRLVAFAIPALLIALFTIIGLWREAGEDVRRRRELEVVA